MHGRIFQWIRWPWWRSCVHLSSHEHDACIPNIQCTNSTTATMWVTCAPCRLHHIKRLSNIWIVLMLSTLYFLQCSIYTLRAVVMVFRSLLNVRHVRWKFVEKWICKIAMQSMPHPPLITTERVWLSRKICELFSGKLQNICENMRRSCSRGSSIFEHMIQFIWFNTISYTRDCVDGNYFR